MYYSISIITFILIVSALVVVRVKTNKQYEIKNSDIILALIPTLLILISADKIKSFDIFGVSAKAESAIQKASNKKIDKQIEFIKSIPVKELDMPEKRGVGKISDIINMNSESLKFKLGHGGYYSPAIEEYFDSLMTNNTLDYVIITNKSGKLFGIYKSDKIYRYLKEGNNWSTFEISLNHPSREAKDSLKNIKGFIGLENSVTEQTNRKKALLMMEKSGVDFLPVVNSSGEPVGVVEQSKLISSLVVDITKILSTNDDS